MGVQARALQRMKMIPDKVVILNGDLGKARETLSSKLKPMFDTPQALLDGVEARIQQYLRHLHSTAETFKNSIVEVDVSDHSGSSVTELVSNIMSREGGDPR